MSRAGGSCSAWPMSLMAEAIMRPAPCLEEASALIKDSRRGNREYNPASHQELVDRLINEFNPSFFYAPRPSDTIQRGLSSYSACHVRGRPSSNRCWPATRESTGPASSVSPASRSLRFRATGRTDSPIECVRYLDAGSIISIAEKHALRLASLAGEQASRVINKMPDNYMYLDCWPSCSRERR